jgi:hypothetical protein
MTERGGPAQVEDTTMRMAEAGDDPNDPEGLALERAHVMVATCIKAMRAAKISTDDMVFMLREMAADLEIDADVAWRMGDAE